MLEEHPVARAVYRHVPLPLQNFLVSLRGLSLNRWRYGGSYHEILDQVLERETYSQEALRSYQSRRLKKQFQVASRTPYWRDAFLRHGVDPETSTPLEALRRLPILTKSEVQNNIESIQPEGLDDRSLRTHETSGTTGSGLAFPVTRAADQEQWATWWRYRRRHELTRNTWCGHFGGKVVVPQTQQTPPYWRINAPLKQVYFSIFHLSRDTAKFYLREIAQRRLKWLHGYPSVLSLLASYSLESELPTIQCVDIVTTGAESLLPRQRELISTAFQAQVRDHYGLAERVTNISECATGSLHVDEDFAITEFLPVDDDSAQYRIVGTSLTNDAFPLFRYDTGDVATLPESSNRGCNCGRSGRVVESIDGRIEDYVQLPDGRRVGRLDHIFKSLTSIREAQIYQPELTHITIRIVPGNDLDSDTLEVVRKRARARLGSTIDISISETDSVSRTDRGKIRFVLSDVDADALD